MVNSSDFKELLSKAPVGPDENALLVVGVLTRSSNPSKFGLFLSSGDSVALDIESVLKHEVLGDSFGRTLVRLTLDSGKVPAEIAQKVRGSFGASQTAPDIGAPFVLQHGHHASPVTVAALEALSSSPNRSRTSPWDDAPKDPISDNTWPTPYGQHRDW